MPKKHPNTIRWGGPGASHEDRTKPIPDPPPAHPEDAVSTNPRVSLRSGGGGERDEKHSAVDPMRSSKSHATDGASPSELDRAYKPNRPRNDRDAQAHAENEAEGGDEDEDEDFTDEGAEDEAAEGVELPVLLNTDSSVEGTERLAGRVERIVRARLRHLAPHLTRVEAHVTDAKRAGTGPNDMRCALEARPRHSKPVAADHVAATAEDAVRGAAGKISRLLRSQFGRRRQAKGGETIRGTTT
ncbi:hypothetical protein J8J14_03520 [Roseomonas sp. SSH11]|uniref:Uncharacterized protein n=1 Tax=Pararoseomonas baculiformis TaxID=2820812 RepID=A0ABS4AA13_9PROT|nr:hypothetical protein [Pararoseomonas baculiformis]MBP0443840.1 hypothetical protein [Pararoseomonas baculiformis]